MLMYTVVLCVLRGVTLCSTAAHDGLLFFFFSFSLWSNLGRLSEGVSSWLGSDVLSHLCNNAEKGVRVWGGRACWMEILTFWVVAWNCQG